MYPKLESIGRMVLASLFAISILLGCSSGASNPVNPGNPEKTDQAVTMPDTMSLGIYDIVVDIETGEMEAIPNRTADLTVNIMNLVKTNPSLIGLSNLDASEFASKGIVSLDISVKHPLPQAEFTIFDTMGILVSNGSDTSSYDNTVKYPGKSDTRLLNSDGCTRWMNPVEFTTTGFFGYTPWNFGSQGVNFTGTIDGYKYHASGLGVDQDAGDFIGNPAYYNRGALLPSETSKRHYEIQFPMPGGTPVIQFQYQIIARWENAGVPNPQISDFPPAANCQEAVQIGVDASDSTLWYSGGSSGGDINMLVTVFDWQGDGDVFGQINELAIESPMGMIPGGFVIYTSADLANALIISEENSATFLFAILNCSPKQPDFEELLITVQSSDPTTYALPGEFPTDTHLSAYALIDIPVAPCVMPDNAIFVATPDQGGDDLNSGEKPNEPVAHLSVALQKADSGEFSEIRVADGEYTEDTTIELIDGVSIYGACDPEQCWVQKASILRSKITFLSQNIYGAVYGKNILSSTLISQMEFHAPLGTTEAPNSVTVYLDTCTEDLQFLNCWFYSYKGADGEAGPDGEDGLPGCPGTNGGNHSEIAPPDVGIGCGPSWNRGGNGGKAGYYQTTVGEPGEDGISNQFGGQCVTPGGEGCSADTEDGIKGDDGAKGGPGSHGNGGDGIGLVTIAEIWHGSSGDTGSNGDVGCAGGGGGGGCGNLGAFGYTYGGAGGGGGEGGYGGFGGSGGQGGGASFCVFLSNASPLFNLCRFTAGSGGEGGHGGDAGQGGLGGEPGLGGVGYEDPKIGYGGMGGYGGKGGLGGLGGLGGGGGGGISFCIYRHAGSAPTLTDCNYQPGEGGQGGDAWPGGNPGESGLSGEIYP